MTFRFWFAYATYRSQSSPAVCKIARETRLPVVALDHLLRRGAEKAQSRTPTNGGTTIVSMASRAQRVDQLFADCVELDAAERCSVLEHECGNDVELRDMVQKLLTADDAAGSEGFLEWSPPPATGSVAADALVGARLGPYQIMQRLAAGATGVVYRAERVEGFQQQVAIKILRPWLSDAVGIARFRAEQQALADLPHPNIARLLDAGTTNDDSHYLVLEFIDGYRLDEAVAVTQPSLRRKMEWLLTICRAVAFAHERGIVHRDLKPANVLMSKDEGRTTVNRGGVKEKPESFPLPSPTEDHGAAKGSGRLTGVRFREPSGELPGNMNCASVNSDASSVMDASCLTPKITDFGLAKITNARGNALTATGEVMGTPGYMAPEQIRGAADALGFQTDVYGLGAVMYFLLVGKPPFRGGSVSELLHELEHRDPASPASIVRGIPADLNTICLKCIQKEPRHRYASVDELADEVQRYLAGYPVQARPISAVAKVLRWSQRNRVVATLAGLLMVVLLMAIVVTTTLFVVAERRRHEAEQDRKAALLTIDRLMTEISKSLRLQPGTSELRNSLLAAAKEAYDAQAVGTSGRRQAAAGRSSHRRLSSSTVLRSGSTKARARSNRPTGTQDSFGDWRSSIPMSTRFSLTYSTVYYLCKKPRRHTRSSPSCAAELRYLSTATPWSPPEACSPHLC